jgi:hypothetical protein
LKSALGTIGLLLFSPALVGASEVVVPSRFVGEWANSREHCGSGSDDMELRISEDHVFHWESDGPILAIVVRGQSEIAFIAELSDEGETWLSAYSFKLSPDGLQLVDTSSTSAIVRFKCPATAGRPSNTSFKSTRQPTTLFSVGIRAPAHRAHQLDR